MKYLFALLPIFFILSCSEDFSTPIEPEGSQFQFHLNDNDIISIEGNYLDYNAAQDMYESVKRSFEEELALVRIKEVNHKASNKPSFTAFPWWNGSYYWENYQDLNITYQSYTIGFINEDPNKDLTIYYYRKVGKGSPIIPFFKWHWQEDADNAGYGKWTMTCVSARLIGPNPERLDQRLEVQAQEVRNYNKLECIFNPDKEEYRAWTMDFGN